MSLADNENVPLAETLRFLTALVGKALIALPNEGILVARSDELQARLEATSD